MKIHTLLSRLRIVTSVLCRDPVLFLRLPGFLRRTLSQGPYAFLDRLRRISDPMRLPGDFDNFSRGYSHWRSRTVATAAEKAAMSAWAQTMSSLPRIAVLMPVFNPHPEWLKSAIDSVRAQLYPHWQLCIADDCSTDPRIRLLLQQAATEDARIQVVSRGQNGHICAASNSALELIQAPWFALLDQDGLLPDDALIWIAKAIADHPNARLFYSDEDKLSPDGLFFDPYFKGNWNAVLMEGQNTFSHLGVYCTDLVRQVGGFRAGFEGSQDHDLVLRCSEQLKREQIIHVPRVLYHWRVHPESAAIGLKVKPYALQASERAVAESLQRRGLPLQCMNWSPAGSRAVLVLPNPAPRVSVIVPTRNCLNVLRPCLQSLLEKTSYPDMEVLVVDNGSDDPATLQFLADLESLQKIRVLVDPSPFNYSALNNRAVAHATGDFICLLNNDIEVIVPGWLEELVVQALRPGIGAVGAQLLYPDRTIQHGGVLLGVGGVANHAHLGWPAEHPGYFGRAQLTQEIAAVTGACLLVSRTNYLSVGGLDEENLKVAFNDVDFCLKLREQGLQNLYAPGARLIHHESISRGQDLAPEKAARFAAEVAWMQHRWGSQLCDDPFYNPNLSLDNPYFRLAHLPRVNRWPFITLQNSPVSGKMSSLAS